MTPEQLEVKMKMAALETSKMKTLAEAVGGILVESAQGMAPVLTGALRRSIAYRLSDQFMTLTADVYYAPYVEYGTRYMRAQPFLGPAIEQNADRVEEIQRDWGVKLFDKVAKAEFE